MSTLVFAQSDWAAAAVALGMLAVVALLMTVAFVKGGMESATKMWALLGTIIGLLTGSAGTIFFTRTTAATAQAQAATSASMAHTATATIDAANRQIQKLELNAEQQQKVIQTLQADLLVNRDALEQYSTQLPLIRSRPERLTIPQFELIRPRGGDGR